MGAGLGTTHLIALVSFLGRAGSLSKPAESRDRPTATQWLTRLVPYAVWGADLDFMAHRARNAATIPPVPAGFEPALEARLEQDRALALSGGDALARRLRVYVPLGVALLGGVGMLGGLVHLAMDWGEASWLELALPLTIPQGVAGIGLWVYQGLLRESVVRHEARQVLVTLVAEGLSPADAEVVQRRLSLGWRLRRAQDTGLALISLGLPLLGVACFPLAFLRSAGSVAQHELHEASLTREGELARKRAA